MTEQLLPPANWYADPEGSGRWRYWDGAAWTTVYLNQAEPGPSVWAQYWERAKPGVFVLAVLFIVTSAAFGGGFISLCIGIGVAGATVPGDGTSSPGYRWACVVVAVAGALVIGTETWIQAAGVAVCGAAMVPVGRLQRKDPGRATGVAAAVLLIAFGAFLAWGGYVWRG